MIKNDQVKRSQIYFSWMTTRNYMVGDSGWGSIQLKQRSTIGNIHELKENKY